MTYPPGSPGYPPAQQPTTQFAAPTQQFGKVPDAGPAAAEGPSKLPVYLTAAVAALGLALYLSSFGPLFTAGGDFFTPILLNVGIVASLLAALIAGIGLLPKQKATPAIVAVLSVLGFLLVILIVLTVPGGVTLDWGMYLIITFTVLQAIVAVAAVLFDAGVIAPPAPKPRYEQQYGQYGAPGQYYGQPQHHGGPPQHQQGAQHQRPGYPSQYGGYPGGGPSTGGFSGGPQSGSGGPQGGPPTPPTGFPTYGQPPSGSGAPTTQVPAQPQSSSSSQSGPAPS